MYGQWCRDNRIKIVGASGLFLVLALLPVPLLPPHRLAEVMEHGLGLSWVSAYFIAAIGVQVTFYFCIGVLAALVAGRGETIRAQFLQVALLPLAIVGAAVIIRSLRAGHLPHWINTAVPALACFWGVALGLSLLYRYLKTVAVVSLFILAGSLWMMLNGTSSSLRYETEMRLHRLAVACPGFTTSDSRFGTSLQTAFAPEPSKLTKQSAIDENRAAILAWGIAVGHARLARFVGLDSDGELVLRATKACQGITLNGREDWSRHYAVSAALSVLETPLVSDAGGLMKEQLDSLTQGSGFSFGDLTADRAGVRFAVAATSKENAARTMQRRIQGGVSQDEFFPAATDLPENLTVEQFRAEFGGVGTRRYYEMTRKIESLLDGCAALSSFSSNKD